MTNCFISGALSISQATDLTEIQLRRSYDFALAAVSWERRSSAAFRACSNLPKKSIFIRFDSSDRSVDEKKDEAEVELKALFESSDLFKLKKSTQFMENAEAFEQILLDKHKETGRPIRLLVDITCLPKSYLMFLIGLGFSRDYISRLDCIYSEGDYSFDDVVQIPSNGDICFVSEGEWGALQIPYLGSASSIPNHRDLLVSMGGEIGLSLPFIDRYEPRSLGMIVIKDGLFQSATKIPESEAIALNRILSEGNVERFDIGIADVVSTIAAVKKFCANAASETISGIVLGSKPHALAFGIAALNLSNLEIICRIPKRYRPLDVAPNGRFAFYTIEDRFEPSGYFDEKPSI